MLVSLAPLTAFCSIELKLSSSNFRLLKGERPSVSFSMVECLGYTNIVPLMPVELEENSLAGCVSRVKFSCLPL